jgi:hypothetical protein
MPLIHDNPWLVSQLLKSAIDEEERLKLYKKGQTAPNPQVAGALKALLNSLRDQITPLKEGPNQVGHASGGAELASGHMDSMGDLVEWMSANGTRIGGTTIVVPGTAERPSEDYGHYKIEPGTEIVVPLASPDRTTKAYWINPAVLKQYLVSLQSDPKLKNNVIFQVQLLKLVQDANKQLDLDVGETYQAPALDDNQEVDRLPKTINLRQWVDPGSGTESLQYKDIKSLEAFNAWFGQNNRGYLLGQQPVTTNSENWNPCVVINYLQGRVGHLLQRRTAQTGPIYQAYAKALTDLAGQANCPAQPGGSQPGQEQQGGAGKPITPRALVGLATLKPFNTQRIDFQEITTFLDRYVQLKPSMEGLALQAKNAMQQANGVMNSPGAPFPVGNVTKQTLESRTRNPQYLLQYLHNVIDTAGRVYMDFFNECQNALRDLQGGSGIIAGVEEQIAAGGPYQYNLSTLERLQEQYPASH